MNVKDSLELMVLLQRLKLSCFCSPRRHDTPKSNHQMFKLNHQTVKELSWEEYMAAMYANSMMILCLKL